LLEEGRARLRENAFFNELLNFGERERSLNELVAERMEKRIEARQAAASAGRPSVLFDVIMLEEREDAVARAVQRNLRRRMRSLSAVRMFADLQAVKRAFAEAKLSEAAQARVLAGIRRNALKAFFKEGRSAAFRAQVSRASLGYRVEQVFADSGGLRLVALYRAALRAHANSFNRAALGRR
jgi:hypothetical protein